MPNDKFLTCLDCDAQFPFSVSDQSFFAQQGIASEPKRCPECRVLMRAHRQNPTPVEFSLVSCSECSTTMKVQLRTNGQTPFLCVDCLHLQQARLALQDRLDTWNVSQIVAKQAADNGTITVGLVAGNIEAQGLIAEILGAEPDLALLDVFSSPFEALDSAVTVEARKLDVLINYDQGNVAESQWSCTALKERFKETAIILVHQFDASTFLDFVKAGIRGYCWPGVAPARLVDAVRSVHRGGIWLDVSAENFMTLLPGHVPPSQSKSEGAPQEELTAREVQVLNLLVAGMTNTQIATQMSFSVPTIKAHLRSIFQKLRVTDRTQAVVTALRNGIVDLGLPRSTTVLEEEFATAGSEDGEQENRNCGTNASTDTKSP